MDIKTLLKKSATLFIGKIAVQVMSFILSIFLARYLGAQNYGVLAIAFSIQAILGAIIGLGLSNSTIHFTAKFFGEGEEKGKASIHFFLKWRFIPVAIASVVLFLIAEPLANAYQTPELATVLKMFSFSYTFLFLRPILTSTLKGLEKMKYVTYVKFVWGLSVKILPVVLAGLTSNLIITALGFPFAYFISFLAALVLLLKEIDIFEKVKETIDKKEVLRYGLKTYLIKMVSLGQFRGAIMIIGLYTVGGASFFQIGKNMGRLVAVFYGSLSGVLFPTISNLWFKDKGRSRRLFKKTMRYRIILSAPFLFLFLLLGSSGVGSLYGKEFVSAYPILMLVFGRWYFRALFSGLFFTLVMATENVSLGLKGNLIKSVLNLTLVWFLVQYFGVLGAALGFLIAMAAGETYYTIKIKKKTRAKYPKKTLARSLFACLAASSLSYLPRYFLKQGLYEFILILPLFLGVYLTVLYLTDEIKNSEVVFIKKKIKERIRAR